MNYNFNNDVSEIAKRFKKNYIPQNKQNLTPDTYLFEKDYNNSNNNYSQVYNINNLSDKNVIDYIEEIKQQQYYLLPDIVISEREKPNLFKRIFNTARDIGLSVEQASIKSLESGLDAAAGALGFLNKEGYAFKDFNIFKAKDELGAINDIDTDLPENYEKYIEAGGKLSGGPDDTWLLGDVPIGYQGALFPKLQANLENFIARDLTDELINTNVYNFRVDPVGTLQGNYGSTNATEEIMKNSFIPEEHFAREVSQSIGQMLPSVALSVVNPALGTVAFGLTAGGSALEEGIANGATFEEAFSYAGAVALIETLIEKASGGIGGVGTGWIDNALQKSGNALVAKVSNNSLVKFAGNVFGEGLEEVASEFIDPYLRKATIDPDAPTSSFEDLLKSFVIGAATSAIMQGGQSAIFSKNNIDIKSEVNEIQNLINYQTEAYNKGRFGDAEKLAEMIEKKSQRLGDKLGLNEELSSAVKEAQTISKLSSLEKASTKKNSSKYENVYQNIENSLSEDLKQMDKKRRIEFINKNKLNYMFNQDGNLKQNYKKLTQEQKNKANEVKSVINKLDSEANVNFIYANKNNQGYFQRNTNTITINLNATDPYRTVGMHEFIHSLEKSQTYQDFKDFIVSNLQKRNRYKTEFDSLSSLYKKTFEESSAIQKLQSAYQKQEISKEEYNTKYEELFKNYVEEEMVAKVASEEIFSNDKVIKDLVGENKSLGKRILNWIKEKLNKKQPEYNEWSKELKTAKKLFEKALAEKKESSEEEKKLKIKVDSNKVQNYSEKERKYSLKEKTFKFSDDYKNKLKQDSFFDNYEFKTVSIDKLVKDNNLYAEDHLSTYHELEWGTDIEKYSIDEEKINDWSFNPPRAVYKDGKYIIEDGKHRIKALQNDGYDNIELLVYNEDVKYSLKEKKTKAPNVKNTKDIPATYVKGKAEYQRQKVYSKREATGIYEELIHNIANESGIAIDKNVEKNTINYIYQQLNTNKATSIQIADKVIDYIMKESGLSKGNLPIEYEQNLIKDFRDFIATEAFYGGKLSFRTKMENKISNLKYKLNYQTNLFKEAKKIVNTISKLKEASFKEYQYTAGAEQISDMLKKGVTILKDITISNFNKPETRDIIQKLRNDWYNERNDLLDIDKDIVEQFNKIITNINSKEVLSIEEIVALRNILNYMSKTITDFDKVRINGKKESISEMASKAIEKVENTKSTPKNKVSKTYRKSVVKPSTYFRSIEGTVLQEEGVLNTLLVKEIRRSETKFYENVMKLMKPFDDFFENNKKYKNKLSKKTITIAGKQVKLKEAISIYLLSLREQARGHFMSDVDKNAKGINFYDDKGAFLYKLILTQEDIDALYKEFDAEDVKYMSLVKEFFNKAARDLKVEADIANTGSTNILEENYYPIITDLIVRYKNLGDPKSKNLDSLFGLYFNEDIVEGANSEIKMMGVDTMVFSHLQKVSRYNAYMEVVKNIRQVLNKKVVSTPDNNGKKALLQVIEEKNPGFEAYLDKYLRDSVTSVKLSSDESKFLASIRKNYASFALGMKFSTVANQFTIIPTAINVLSPKSLLKVTNVKLRWTDNQMDVYCPYAKYRNYSGNIKTSEINIESSLNTIQDKMLWFMAAADRQTVKYIWRACQIEAKDKYGYEFGSKQNLEKAGELLEETLRKTQALDTSEQTELFRTDSDLVKWVLLFQKQNVQTLSTITDYISQHRTIRERIKVEGNTEANKAKLKEINIKGAKALAGLLTSSLAYTLVAMLFKKILHKDDEEKNDLLEIGQDFLGNVVGMVPLFNMVYNKFFEGYDMKLSALDMFNDGADALTGMYDSIRTGNFENSWYKFANAFGMATGIPTKNILEYGTALIGTFNPDLAYKYRGIFYNKTVSEYTNDFEKSLKSGDSKSAKSILEQIYNEKHIDVDSEIIQNIYPVLKSYKVKNASSVFPKTANQTVTYDSTEYKMSDKQYKKFKDKYTSNINTYVKTLVRSSKYFSLQDDEKAQAIKYVQDFAYFKTVQEILNVDTSDSTKLNLLSGVIRPEIIAIVLAKCKGTLKGDKVAIQRYINSLSVPREQKYILYGLLGYKPIQENAYVQVSNYLTTKGYSVSKIQNVLEKCKLI